jgi:hypothetical protein
MTSEQQKQLDGELKKIDTGKLLQLGNLSKTLWQTIEETNSEDELHSLERANQMLTLSELIKDFALIFDSQFDKYFESVFDMDK